MTKKYKTGLVLSGGGTRGFVHLGIIAALYEKGIKPDVISGTSAGSIVGAFIAGGKSPEEIYSVFHKGWFLKYTKFHIPVDGLLRLDGLKKVIRKEIQANTIEDLKIPLFVSVSNLNRGIVEYKNSGPLGDIVLASSSIPILFPPVKINDEFFVDGGLMDNIPIEPIKNDCEQIIVSNVTPINPRKNFKNIIQAASRTFYMCVKANMQQVHEYATIIIEPDTIDNFDILSIGHAKELFELGYNAGSNAFKNLDT
ncbi:MAG: patatin-like phospholipase family protein [Bacteroidales bacterium]|jgi:NTE family protein|nr:patatin-like phospholipase family protein [Bacteroidales bacterium]